MQDAANQALTQQQIDLERLYNKNQLIPRIRAEFEENPDVDFDKVFEHYQIPKALGYAFLVQLVLHKRCSLGTMVAILRHHCDTAQEVADHIKTMCEADLAHWQPYSSTLIVAINITQDVQHELDLFQFPLPMVVEPKQVISNRDTGYLSDPVNKGSVILKKNHHEDDVCLDHINRMNKVRFKLDMETAHMIQNSWRNLDKPKEGETKEDFEKRKKAFDKYDRTAKAVMAEINRIGDHFHLTHKYDKRGRVYSQGYHVNYQGAAWNKAVIQLADAEVVS